MKKSPVIIKSIEIVYLFIIGSVQYWGTLIRSGLIYGFVDAALSVLVFLQENNMYTPTNLNTKQKTGEGMPFKKRFSFIWTGLLSICLANYFFIEMGSSQYVAGPMLVASVTLFSFYHVFLVLSISIYSNKKEVQDKKWLYAYTVDYMIRKPFRSLFILLLTLSMIGMAYFNLIVFVFFVPSFFWLFVQKGLQVK
ncbi:MAG: hypothetical protein KC455_04230 [Carnobacterium sp.]|nr:hypothetical protein [Carnobacterium sp.]